MAESKLKIMSMEFAVSAIKLCDSLKGHYSLVNQFERSATSVGANINEANYGQSKADFISKMQIALKETAETEYWLRLLMLSEYIKDKEYASLLDDCLEIKRILISSINTAKENK